VFFAEKDVSQSSSQIHAFEDTWEWNIDAERAYEQIVEGGGRVADALRAFRTFLGGSDMMAYLAMMAPRLVELRRVLKETGDLSTLRFHRQPLPEDQKAIVAACLKIGPLSAIMLQTATKSQHNAALWRLDASMTASANLPGSDAEFLQEARKLPKNGA